MAHVSCETPPKRTTAARVAIDTVRQPPVSGVASEFASETSLHGVKYTLQDGITKPRRLFWVLVVAAQLTGFVIIVESHVRYIYSRPIVTKATNRYPDRMPFPGVTVCSQIPAINLSLEAFADLGNKVFKRSAVGNNMLKTSALGAKLLKSSDLGNDLLTSTQILNGVLFPSLSNLENGNITLSDITEVTKLLQGELIEQCVFANANCSDYVKKFISEELNPRLCYTVNGFVDKGNATQAVNDSSSRNQGEQKLAVLESMAPGVEGGLTLKINLQDAVNTGLQIFLHEPHEPVPMGLSDFLKLAPGTENYIKIKVKQKTYLPPPYKAFGDRECMVTSGDFRHPLVPRGRYTLRACHDACHVQWWKRLCGVDMAGNIFNPAVYLECVKKAGSTWHNISFSISTCDCPLPCEEVDYETTLSAGLDASIPESLRLTVLSVNIHFDRMRVESTEQVEGYTQGDVFASVGGQMGLFLGASLITLVEVAEFMFRWACGWFCRCSHK